MKKPRRNSIQLKGSGQDITPVEGALYFEFRLWLLDVLLISYLCLAHVSLPLGTWNNAFGMT